MRNMWKTSWSLFALVMGVTGFVMVAIASPFFVTPLQPRPNGMMGDMMGMMGWWIPSSENQYSYPPLMWVIPVAFLFAIVLGIMGLSYRIILPEIGTKEPQEEPRLVRGNAGQASIETIMKALKPDERKVFSVLMAHEGRYLQKWIRKEAGLSRLQVHRIVARLAERGLVTVRVVGNTNEISLADWLTVKQDGKNQTSA